MKNGPSTENAQLPVVEEVQTPVESEPKKFTFGERFTSVFSFPTRNSQFLQSTAIFGASILALGAATAALTFFQVPAALGLVGYSLAGQIGISLGLATAGAALLSAAKVGLNKLANRNKPVVDTDPVVVADPAFGTDSDSSQDLHIRATTIVGKFQATNDDSKSESISDKIKESPRAAAIKAKEAIHTQAAPSQKSGSAESSESFEVDSSSSTDPKKDSRIKNRNKRN